MRFKVLGGSLPQNNIRLVEDEQSDDIIQSDSTENTEQNIDKSESDIEKLKKQLLKFKETDEQGIKEFFTKNNITERTAREIINSSDDIIEKWNLLGRYLINLLGSNKYSKIKTPTYGYLKFLDEYTNENVNFNTKYFRYLTGLANKNFKPVREKTVISVLRSIGSSSRGARGFREEKEDVLYNPDFYNESDEDNAYKVSVYTYLSDPRSAKSDGLMLNGKYLTLDDIKDVNGLKSAKEIRDMIDDAEGGSTSDNEDGEERTGLEWVNIVLERDEDRPVYPEDLIEYIKRLQSGSVELIGEEKEFLYRISNDDIKTLSNLASHKLESGVFYDILDNGQISRTKHKTREPFTRALIIQLYNKILQKVNANQKIDTQFGRVYIAQKLDLPEDINVNFDHIMQYMNESGYSNIVSEYQGVYNKLPQEEKNDQMDKLGKIVGSVYKSEKELQNKLNDVISSIKYGK